jgi:beta-galactosidase
MQAYEPAGGQAVGKFSDGRIAAIERNAGKGKVLLIGTFPGAGYFLHHSPATREFFAGLLDWAGIRRLASVDSADVKARIHQGAGSTYLWVVNPTRKPQKVTVRLDDRFGKFSAARDLWQESSTPKISGTTVEVAIEDRNVAVLQLVN